MRKQATQALIIATLALCAGGGCSQIQTVFHRPGDGAPTQSTQVSSRSVTTVDDGHGNLGERSGRSISGKLKMARVASYQPADVLPAPVQSKPNTARQRRNIETNPAPSGSAVTAKNIDTNGLKNTDDVGTTSQSDTRSADASKRRYTAPGAAIRGMGQLANSTAAFALGTADNNAAASLSQSLVTDAQGIQGAAGLTAPSPSTGGVLVSANSLISNNLPALGRAAPNTIRDRQVNLASGPNGGLCALARAGLLQNNSACQTLRHKH
jgi:hypothetical protein